MHSELGIGPSRPRRGQAPVSWTERCTKTLGFRDGAFHCGCPTINGLVSQGEFTRKKQFVHGKIYGLISMKIRFRFSRQTQSIESKTCHWPSTSPPLRGGLAQGIGYADDNNGTTDVDGVSPRRGPLRQQHLYGAFVKWGCPQNGWFINVYKGTSHL